MRRKRFFYCVVLAITCLFLPFFIGNTAKNGDEESLKEVAKTHVGVYRCEKMCYGGRNFTEFAESATLELKKDGTYVFSICVKESDVRKRAGKYEIDRESIAFITDKGDVFRRYPRKNEAIVVTEVLHGKTLYAVFSRK